MEVSCNRGIPKSSTLMGFFIINHPFWGTRVPPFMETLISLCFIMVLNTADLVMPLRCCLGLHAAMSAAGAAQRRGMARGEATNVPERWWFSQDSDAESMEYVSRFQNHPIVKCR